MENCEVRGKAKAAGIPLWKIASRIGISEPTLTRWLRFPLNEERYMRVVSAIEELSQEGF